LPSSAWYPNYATADTWQNLGYIVSENRMSLFQARQLLRQIEEVLHTDGPTDFLKKLDEVGLSSKVEELNQLVKS